MFNNVQTPSPTEAAKTEIIRLFQIECGLTEKRRQKMLDLDAIRHGAAQAVVDGTAGIEDAAARVAQRQSEVAAAEEAIAIARQRRLKAIQQRFRIEASELPASAAKCRQDAADILKRCEPLLRKLSDLQGLTYDSTILLAQRNSQWTGSYITGAPIEECNPMEATADINAGFLAPRGTSPCRRPACDALAQSRDREGVGRRHAGVSGRTSQGGGLPRGLSASPSRTGIKPWSMTSVAPARPSRHPHLWLTSAAPPQASVSLTTAEIAFESRSQLAASFSSCLRPSRVRE